MKREVQRIWIVCAVTLVLCVAAYQPVSAIVGVGQWPFNEGSGTTVHDFLGTEDNMGTLGSGENAPTWSSDAPEGSWSLSFDGTDIVQVPTAGSELHFGGAGSKITIRAWIKTSITPTAAMAIVQRGASFNLCWSLSVSATEGKVGRVAATIANPPDIYVTYGPIVNDGNWHHVAFTFDSALSDTASAGKMWKQESGAWVDRTLDHESNTGNVPAGLRLDKPEELMGIGASPTTPIGNGFKGSIDLVEIGDIADATLPVFLSSFTALAGDGQVTLKWNTIGEVENLGFNVYRSLAAEGPYTKLTYALIPGAGSSTEGHAYMYLDQEVLNGISYYYKIEDVALDGTTEMHGPVMAIPVAGVAVSTTSAPKSYRLGEAFPNPFNPMTVIEYDLAAETPVDLMIYDVLGRRIRRLVSGTQSAGRYVVAWDGLNAQGTLSSSGVYLYRLQTPDFVETKKVTLLR